MTKTPEEKIAEIMGGELDGDGYDSSQIHKPVRAELKFCNDKEYN